MNTIGKTTLIAHRGESEDAPENTLPAYRMAVDRGFGFECDVYLSLDKRVFTFHDRDLTRTTAGVCTKKCGEVTWDELQQLDVGGWGKWAGSKYSPTHPVLLEEVLKLARDGRKIYLEVKPGPEIVPYIRDIFAAQTNATSTNLLFISFNQDTCRAIKKLMPEYTVYWLTASRYWKAGSWGDKSAPPVTAEEINKVLAETGADGVDIHYDPELSTVEMIEAIHATGHTYHVWTVDNLADAQEAFKRGVDTVTTNCAQRLLNESLA